MLVGLNWSSESGEQPENELPNEHDEVYFQVTGSPSKSYYKGVFKTNQFYVDNDAWAIDCVDYWVLTSDPTAIQRLIFYLDLDFYFDAADWERTITEDGVIEDSYPNPPSSVNMEELELSKQTETLLKKYIEFAESYGSFSCTDPIALHNINQMGLFVYEELRKELSGKCYLVFYPIVNLSTEFTTAFPLFVDNNENQIDWKFVNKELPNINKSVKFQLDSYTGEFYKGIFNGTAFISENNYIFNGNQVVRWQYL